MAYFGKEPGSETRFCVQGIGAYPGGWAFLRVLQEEALRPSCVHSLARGAAPGSARITVVTDSRPALSGGNRKQPLSHLTAQRHHSPLAAPGRFAGGRLSSEMPGSDRHGVLLKRFDKGGVIRIIPHAWRQRGGSSSKRRQLAAPPDFFSR